MSECCGCGKVVDVAALQAKQRRVLRIVLAINLATFAMMLFAAGLLPALLIGGMLIGYSTLDHLETAIAAVEKGPLPDAVLDRLY